MKTITKIFTITATPDTMLRFERFMAFFHFNGGHSGLFGMCFDGDGHERFKCDPPPDKCKDHWIINTGQELEIAGDTDYKSYSLDRDKHHYVAKDGVLTRIYPNGEEEIRRVVSLEDDD